MRNKLVKYLKIIVLGLISATAVSYLLCKQCKLNKSIMDDLKKEVCVIKTIQDGNQPVFYYVYGDTSKDLIVLIHPAFGDHQCFYHQVDEFAKDHCVISIDLVGHGRSQVKDSNIRIDRSAFHIAEIMKAENFNSAHLVGVSMGGLILQYFSINYPEKTKSITALGAYDINTNDSRLSKFYGINSLVMVAKVLFCIDSFRRDIAELSVVKKEEQERFFMSACHFKHKSFKIMTTLNEISKSRTGIYPDSPLLILCGDQDNSLALESAQNWKNRSSMSKYVIIENAGHCANMDNPSKFNEIVLEFIDNNNHSGLKSTS